MYEEDSHLDSHLKEIESFTEKHHVDYFLVSANTGENVDDLFYEIIYKIFNVRISNESYEFIEEINKYKGYHLEHEEVNALKDLEHIIIESLNNQSKYFQKRSKEIEEYRSNQPSGKTISLPRADEQTRNAIRRHQGSQGHVHGHQ